ncbi:MAG: MFS transporter [Evtepia sp.]
MKHVHYGWVVCITCTLLLFITMGTVSNGFSVYLPYIMDERGLTHAQTSSLVTLRCLTAFLAMLTIGWYCKKVSLRLGVSIAACCAGLSYLLYASAQTYPLFCVGAAVSGLSYGFGSMIPVSLLMNRWFDRHRALALSICATGSGIATIVLPPVTTALVEHLTMGTAFRIEGAAIFLWRPSSSPSCAATRRRRAWPPAGIRRPRRGRKRPHSKPTATSPARPSCCWPSPACSWAPWPTPASCICPSCSAGRASLPVPWPPSSAARA